MRASAHESAKNGQFSDWIVMNNGHFSRQGHNNKNRNRNRNRRHTGGGGGNHSGGSGSNRVLDSNGPDVKLRGTAQTIAEKYIQLGRDAQLAGDRVMSESYYQHGEHYYRLWLANQPAGAPTQFARRPGDDEYEDDQAEGGESDDEAAPGEGVADVGDTPEQVEAGDEQESAAPAADGQNQQRQQGRRDGNRDANRDGGRDAGREGGGRDRFRNRWPRRNERNADQPRDAEPAPRAERGAEAEEGNADWGETPSFLTRAVPTPPPEAVETAETAPVIAEPAPERRPRREFKPRRPRETAPEAGDVPVTQDD
jgi:hypothetical protein